MRDTAQHTHGVANICHLQHIMKSFLNYDTYT